jgi:probable 2-oxoglutarate dehydrogenase E1 component DHKTD1
VAHISDLFYPILLTTIGLSAVVTLSGKLYYELSKERQAPDLNNKVAFIRIEELAPFPFEALEKVLSLYPSAVHFSRLQEEPQNQWNHIRSRIETVLSARKSLAPSNGIVLHYLGQKESALPAPGMETLYENQTEECY